jgi:hypothetical protein
VGGYFEGVQPVGRSWHILGQGWDMVDGLMRGIYGVVSPGLEFVAVGNIFEVRVVLVAGGGAEEEDAEEDEYGEGCDDLEAAW